ncbi:MAG: hypothetical protein ACO1SV_03995 [Fimbriimonas sp.]
MIALVLSFAIATQTPAADATFTYRTRGTSVETVLAEVSKLTGVPLAATPATAKEIVIVDVHGAKLTDFMPRLARVADGEWRKEGAGFRLTRSDEFARKSRAAEVAQTALRFQSALQTRLKALTPFGTGEADALAARVQTTLKGRVAANDGNYFRTMQDLNAESPTGRLAIRALAAIGGPALATLQSQERRVYSTRPNRMQRPLPFDPAPLIDLFLKEQAPLSAALRKRLDAEELRTYNGAAQGGEATRPARILFIVSPEDFQSGISVRLLFVDDQGEVSRESQASIPAEGGDRLLPQPEAPKTQEAPIPFDPLSQAFIRTVKALSKNQAAAPDEVLLKALENPERNDPASFVIPDALRALAGRDQVVAQVEDIGFLSAPMLADEELRITPSRFRGWFARGHDLQQAGGWLVATPKRPWDAREVRIDRAHLGRFFRTARAQGGATLDQLAAYALGAPRRYQETVSFVYSFLLQPQVNDSISMDNVEFLRIYGALDPRQRRRLEGAAEPFTMAELPPAARAELAHLAFREGAPLQFHSSGERPDPSKRPLEWEPTEGMPDGLPPTATLGGTLTTQDAVIGQVAAGASGAQEYRPLRAWDLAWNFATNEIGAHPNDTVRYAKYRMGRIHRLQLSARFTPALGTERDITQSEFLNTTPWVAFEALPAPFRDQVTKHLPEARKGYEEMKKRETGNKVPPP